MLGLVPSTQPTRLLSLDNSHPRPPSNLPPMSGGLRGVYPCAGAALFPHLDLPQLECAASAGEGEPLQGEGVVKASLQGVRARR